MKSIQSSDLKTFEIQKILTSCISPRPIALVSSLDAVGNPNLAPFSFFNAMGANPPTLVFSPALRGRDGMIKNTLENVQQNMELVIHVVSYDMVEKVNITGMEYPKGVNEFVKAGFTAIPSDIVKPLRIKESPVHFECKVVEIIQTGSEGGAGNIVRCEILKIHISDDVLDENGSIDEYKLDLVGRMEADFYVRSRKAMFEVKKTGAVTGIGFDALPEFIRNTEYLSGNQIARMAGLETLPDIVSDFTDSSLNEFELQDISNKKIFKIVKRLLKENMVKDALLLLLKFDLLNQSK